MEKLTRRGFAGTLGAGLLAGSSQAARPNILWITCEDMGPHLHACGDSYSVTPNLDALARRGLMYMNAWSNAPVCAPARTAIISGMYPSSTGSEHMRSMVSLPAGMKLFPQYLREAGYYCSNNSKEDYNLEKPGTVWDESSTKAHWRNRAPGQPFFAVFNFTTTHESQIRTRPHTFFHDPAKVRVPAYHPDTPEVRLDWAQYYDNITTMDKQAGRVLEELRQDGLVEDTIVFFFGDHGSGMPRSKRFPYNSGLNVSIIASIPKKFRSLAPPEYKEGAKTDRLVEFVDLAPTMLSLAGLRPPDHLQGRAFMGPYQQPERQFAHGLRGRMDERIDLIRTVRDKRYVYLRNYMPHKIYGQHIAYMFVTPTTRIWKELYDQGKLNEAQRRFWEPKPPEELYDLSRDPDEIHNLATSPAHQDVLKRLRKAQQDHAKEIRDVGFLPEAELHSRSKGSTPYEMGRDPKKYPLERIMAAAEAASSLKPDAMPELLKALNDSDSVVRYWAVMGILMRGEETVKKQAPALRKALSDVAPCVRIAAAEALGRYGTDEDARKSLAALMELAPADKNGPFVSILALNAIEALLPRIKPPKEAIAALPKSDPASHPRANEEYVSRMIEAVLEKL
ncbi:MAG TPA: sulfatase-like hydrolase/transferase [Bryobacteraceae bacterium]|nr:sulfatase-like hydrolase/transferase [Bryobacteraceae bacterium]HPQ13640.1 sulfatase-like hydrolase/transferase [Bryobacteraceae bacterium]HPU71393.1 sulfatase-like hydrolase/transferase [Bryobacteraceae bacterium]